MKEIDVQNKILAAVKMQGGVGFKTNGKFLVGIPDLYVNFPGFVPLLLEVKQLNSKLKADFKNRKICLSKMQSHIMKSIEAINCRTTYSLIYAKVENEPRLYMVDGTKTEFSHNDCYVKFEAEMNLRKLFCLANVRKLK